MGRFIEFAEGLFSSDNGFERLAGIFLKAITEGSIVIGCLLGLKILTIVYNLYVTPLPLADPVSANMIQLAGLLGISTIVPCNFIQERDD